MKSTISEPKKDNKRSERKPVNSVMFDMARVMRLWKDHGGDQFGPHVETVSIPLSALPAFLTDFGKTLCLGSQADGYMVIQEQAYETCRVLSDMDAVLMKTRDSARRDTLEALLECLRDYFEGRMDWADIAREIEEPEYVDGFDWMHRPDTWGAYCPFPKQVDEEGPVVELPVKTLGPGWSEDPEQRKLEIAAQETQVSLIAEIGEHLNDEELDP